MFETGNQVNERDRASEGDVYSNYRAAHVRFVRHSGAVCPLVCMTCVNYACSHKHSNTLLLSHLQYHRRNVIRKSNHFMQMQSTI